MHILIEVMKNPNRGNDEQYDDAEWICVEPGISKKVKIEHSLDLFEHVDLFLVGICPTYGETYMEVYRYRLGGYYAEVKVANYARSITGVMILNDDPQAL